MFPRKSVSARVEGRRLDHSIGARQQPQLSLMLRDVSLGGLAALTNMAIGRGERISVFFPPEGPARGWDAYGRWHLGVDAEKDRDTKGHYKFPYGDFRDVHRCGVLAAESRAGQRKYADIELAAAHLHGMLEQERGSR